MSAPVRPTRQGKVRDLYDLGDRLLLVASDRISAFDWVLPTIIPDKGRVLTGVSAYWFARLGVPHHLIRTELSPDDVPPGLDPADLAGRSMVCRKCEVFPVECVVRGYLAGSGLKEYRQHGTVCGIPLPPGLTGGSPLPEPLFTPATKAETGHDENIAFDEAARRIGVEAATQLRETSLAIYRQASEEAKAKGLILADTKFEFGRLPSGEILLIDEVLTPDSSRYWPADAWTPGAEQISFDKQFVRDFLESTPWDKASPPPPLPAEVVTRTRAKYVEAYERITGAPFPFA